MCGSRKYVRDLCKDMGAVPFLPATADTFRQARTGASPVGQARCPEPSLGSPPGRRLWQAEASKEEPKSYSKKSKEKSKSRKSSKRSSKAGQAKAVRRALRKPPAGPPAAGRAARQASSLRRPHLLADAHALRQTRHQICLMHGSIISQPREPPCQEACQGHQPS